MGCSSYFAVTGTHPLLPFDIVKANYLLPPPDSLLSTTNLVVHQAIVLQKHQEDLVLLKNHVHLAWNCTAICFKHDHTHMICDFNFKAKALILVHNMAIEKPLNWKMCLHYFSPMVVVSKN